MEPQDAPPLDAPTLPRSTRIARWVVVALMVAGVVSIWLPSPAGLIAAMLLVYIGGALLLLIVGDYAKLRQARRVHARMSLEQSAPDGSDARLLVDASGLSGDLVRRWRAGRKWCAWLVA